MAVTAPESVAPRDTEAAQPLTKNGVLALLAERRSEPTTNFHHAAAGVVLAGSERPLRWRAVMLAVSAAACILQLVVVVGVINSVTRPTCSENNGCVDGYYCRVSERQCAPCMTEGYCENENGMGTTSSNVISDLMTSCMQYGGIDWSGDAGRRVSEDAADGSSVSAADCTLTAIATPWMEASKRVNSFYEVNASDYSGHCDACAATENYVSRVDVLRDRGAHVSTADTLTLIFASLFVALYLANEQRDVQLCAVQLRATSSTGGEAAHPAWHVLWMPRVLWLLDAFRRFGVLPFVVLGTVMLTINHGTDALSVCLNTLVLLFLLELDDLLYAHGTSESLRAWVEAHARPVIGAAEDRAIFNSRIALMLSVWILIPCGVRLYSEASESEMWMVQVAVQLLSVLPSLLVECYTAWSPRRAGELLLQAIMGTGFAWAIYLSF